MNSSNYCPVLVSFIDIYRRKLKLIVIYFRIDIHYFHCLQIIEILKMTEADTKSVFGRYGSQRMKDWQEIVRLYEKDNVYIAEAGQILVRNVNYELPSVKKQLSKFDQLIDDAQKKIHDLTTSESVLMSQRAALCQKLGIDGKDLRAEFTAKVKELPKLYADVALAVGKLQQALNLYALSSKNEECLPIVRYVLTKGNTTVYEYVNGEAPLSVEEPPIELKILVDVTPSGGDNEAVSFYTNTFHYFSALTVDSLDYRLILVTAKSTSAMTLISAKMSRSKKAATLIGEKNRPPQMRLISIFPWKTVV